MNKALTFITGLGLGGGLMFMLDPDRGRRRRAYVRDKAVSTWHGTRDTVRKTSRDVGNRAQGLAASARSVLHRGALDPQKLAERVRSRIGRLVSHPGAIQVTAMDDTIVLSGPVLASEASGLLRAVSAMNGVHRVENHLELHESGENVPGLAGGEGRRAGGRTWSPAVRTLAGVTGGALAVYGISRRSRVLGKAASAAGFGLLGRSATNRGVRSLLKVARLAS